MRVRKLGSTGPQVGVLGLGCAGMSDAYGPADESESVATIGAAFDAGITLLDTADFYGMGHNEMVLARGLRGRRRADVCLSVKFGALRDPSGQWLGIDNRPAAVANALTYSLRRLNTDYLDIYRPARLDPEVPIEDTVGEVARWVEKGYVRHVGLSEVAADTVRRAHAVHPISDVQLEYSLFSRGIEDSILPTCRALGIGVTAYGVLARGLLSGHWDATRTATPGDFRSSSPRFDEENVDHNLALVQALAAVAREREITTAQAAIAWVAAQGEDIVPLVGARTRRRLTESLGAADVVLSAQDLQAITDAVPAGAVAGQRYAPALMSMLDSERR